MNRHEKLTVYDTFERELKELAGTIEREFNAILEQGKSTLRVDLKVNIVIDPNDDPRLR